MAAELQFREVFERLAKYRHYTHCQDTGFMQEPQSFACGVLNGFPQY
jgi:hypothetical protein